MEFFPTGVQHYLAVSAQFALGAAVEKGFGFGSGCCHVEQCNLALRQLAPGAYGPHAVQCRLVPAKGTNGQSYRLPGVCILFVCRGAVGHAEFDLGHMDATRIAVVVDGFQLDSVAIENNAPVAADQRPGEPTQPVVIVPVERPGIEWYGHIVCFTVLGYR